MNEFTCRHCNVFKSTHPPALAIHEKCCWRKPRSIRIQIQLPFDHDRDGPSTHTTHATPAELEIDEDQHIEVPILTQSQETPLHSRSQIELHTPVVENVEDREDTVDEWISPLLNNPSFNYDLEFVKFLTECNQGRGMSHKDIQSLIDLIIHAQGKDAILTQFTSLYELLEYRSSLIEGDQSQWVDCTIEVTDSDVPGLKSSKYSTKFYYRDMRQWLLDEFANPEYNDNFALDAVIAEVGTGIYAQRVYNEPHQCEAWADMETAIRRRDRTGVVAALQLYSDKTLVNRKGLSCHPIRATLLNIKHGIRIRNLRNVGYMPTLSKRPVDITR